MIINNNDIYIGLTDFRDNFGVVVVGGQGGSTVLGILDIAKVTFFPNFVLIVPTLNYNSRELSLLIGD